LGGIADSAWMLWLEFEEGVMNPFRDIWFNTGKCIDYFLIKENRKPYLEELVWIQGIAMGLLAFLTSNNPLRYYSLIASPAITVLILRFFYPWALLKSGKLINGQAKREELKLIVSISSIPYLLSLLFIFLRLLIPGDKNYEFGITDIAIWIFYWRILIIGIAKAQRVTYTFALMNILIPSIIITAIYFGLRLLF
jgi:hypothetical protein